MKKVLTLTMVSGLLVATPFVGISSAHRELIRTTLSINLSPRGPVNAGEEVLVFGELMPKRCWLGQAVTVYKSQPKPDPVLGLDTLNSHGEYSVTINPTSDVRIYALVESAFIVNGSGHTHKCMGDRTRIIRIDVA